jgi:hypothetical protein
LLSLKARASPDNGRIAVFFTDDNFAINVWRTKSLLRAIIAADAVLKGKYVRNQKARSRIA